MFYHKYTTPCAISRQERLRRFGANRIDGKQSSQCPLELLDRLGAQRISTHALRLQYWVWNAGVRILTGIVAFSAPIEMCP